MPDSRRVDSSRFSMVPRVDVPRSAFDQRYTLKTTFQGGLLVPIFIDEVLPGDSLRLTANMFGRLATPIVPVLDNIYLETFFFYCPNRLLWSNWERFMGEQLNPADTTAFLVPQIVIADTEALVGTVANAFGLIDPVVGQNYSVSCLPFRMYNQVYNDWFRDEDLTTPAVQNIGDGPDVFADYVLRFRARKADYFTTCRPWPQKPSQSSLTTTFNANTFLPGMDMGTVALGGSPGLSAGAPVTGLGVTALGATAGPVNMIESASRTVSWPAYYSDASHDIRLRANLSNDYPDVRVLISDIRTANQVQLFMERNARGGSRYTELVRAHFGVQSPDARLQRPEYLGGGKSMVNINPIAQTSETTGTNFLGEQAGIASVVGQDHGFSASFTEHGFILGLANVRTDMSYMRGVNRMWFRRTVFDHYFPAWAHLAEQPVLSREIWVDGNTGDETVFGFQERWAEYKWKPSYIAGQFMSTSSATPLTMWHFAPDFTARPLLNDTFITDDPPFDRVLQVAAYLNQEILLDISYQARWVRAMPMFSIPGLGGRF